MKTILLGLSGNEHLTTLLSKHMNVGVGEVTIRQFPDGETYVRILSDVTDTCVILVCTLYKPDEKLLPLYFLSKTARSLGAKRICLVAPYLAYMRQDTIFNPGEGVTSKYFGDLISDFADTIVTVDPHLHRINSLGEVYPIANSIVHATGEISKWITEHVTDPILIGPDSESEQWVRDIADRAHAPFIILQKVRHGDRDVEISVPDLDRYPRHTPVLVDDIISTARTMMTTVKHLKKSGLPLPVAVGVHAVFAGSAYQDLLDAGPKQVVTCNTIPHASNGIDLSQGIAREIQEMIKQ